MRENRSRARWASSLTGHVLLQDGSCLPCLIQDFSAAGARIKVSATATLPDTFDLSFPLTRATFEAHVRWRTEEELGVTFEPFEKPETVVPTDPVHAILLERLLKAEAEKEALQVRMAGLLSALEHVG
jgi:hypothetical protein